MLVVCVFGERLMFCIFGVGDLVGLLVCCVDIVVVECNLVVVIVCIGVEIVGLYL